MIASTLGIAGVIQGLRGLDEAWRKQQTSTTALGGVYNQYVDTNKDYSEVLEMMTQEAALLGIEVEDLEEAYRVSLPITRDYGIAQGLIQRAWTIHQATRLPFLDMLQTLTEAYRNGAYVMDEHRGSFMLGADAVAALTESYLGAGGFETQFPTMIDDVFQTRS